MSKKIKIYKTVLLPIQTPIGDYCWNGHLVCPYFDNEGGHPTCDINIGDPNYDKEDKVPKPEECRNLKEA